MLELFNLVLGWGPMSDAFWKGISFQKMLCSIEFCLLKSFLVVRRLGQFFSLMKCSRTHSIYFFHFCRCFSNLATLLDALDQKFGIQATKAQLLTHLHMPQLFLAMQYHTGTRFQDNPGKLLFLIFYLLF